MARVFDKMYGTTGESVTITATAPLARVSDWVLIDTAIKGESREAVYQNVSENVAYPVKIRLGYYPTTGNKINVSIKMDTWTGWIDGDVDVIEPATFTIAFTITGRQLPEPSALHDTLIALLSFLTPVGSDEVMSVETTLLDLGYGIVNRAESHLYYND